MMRGLLALRRSGDAPLLGSEAAAPAPPHRKALRAALAAIFFLAGVTGLALPLLCVARVHGVEASEVVFAAVHASQGNATTSHDELFGFGIGMHIWAYMPAIVKVVVALWIAVGRCGDSGSPAVVDEEPVIYEEICSGIALAEGQRRNGRRCLSERGWFTGALTGSATVELKEQEGGLRQIAVFIERKLGLPLSQFAPGAVYKVEVRNGSTVLWREAPEPWFVLVLRFALLHVLLPVAYLRVFFSFAPHLGTWCWMLGSWVALKASVYLVALSFSIIRLPVLALFDPVSEARRGKQAVTAQFLLAPELWLVDFVTLAPQRMGLQGAHFHQVYGANAQTLLVLFLAFVDVIGYLQIASLAMDGIFYGDFQKRLPLMSVTLWCCLFIPSGLLLHSADSKS